MKRRSLAAIVSAAHGCLAHSERSANPLDGLAEYISQLKSQKWQPEDIRIVESVVIRILAKMTSDSIES